MLQHPDLAPELGSMFQSVASKRLLRELAVTGEALGKEIVGLIMPLSISLHPVSPAADPAPQRTTKGQCHKTINISDKIPCTTIPGSKTWCTCLEPSALPAAGGSANSEQTERPPTFRFADINSFSGIAARCKNSVASSRFARKGNDLT